MPPMLLCMPGILHRLLYYVITSLRNNSLLDFSNLIPSLFTSICLNLLISGIRFKPSSLLLSKIMRVFTKLLTF